MSISGQFAGKYCEEFFPHSNPLSMLSDILGNVHGFFIVLLVSILLLQTCHLNIGLKRFGSSCHLSMNFVNSL